MVEQAEVPSLDRILVPLGAVNLDETWSLGEALHLFVKEAVDHSLFVLGELPIDAVAVFRAYEFANGLADWTISGWFTNFDPTPRRVEDIVRGLKRIGADQTATLVEQAGQIWAGSGDFKSAAEADRFDTTSVGEAKLIAQSSLWVRESPLTVVLGDGGRETVYKQVMLQLFRCNPAYPERRKAQDERRIRLRLKPVGPSPYQPCSLDELIAEMQMRHG